MNSNFPVKHIFFILTAIIWIGYCGCTQFRGNILTESDLKNPLYTKIIKNINGKKIKKGYGIVDIKIQGERIRGEFELVSFTSSDSCILTLYSSLGTKIGALFYGEDSTIIVFQDTEYRLSSLTSIDTLKYLLNMDISFQDFMTMLRGSIPSFITDQPMALLNKKIAGRSIVVTYEGKKRINKMFFLLRSGRIKRIVLDYSSQGNSFLITQSRFKRDIPTEFFIQADNKNYFKIKYKKMYDPN